MIILAGPGVTGNPASVCFFWLLRRVGMGGVVVDGAHYHAAGPGSDSGERGALEFSGLIVIARLVIARFQVFHFAVLAGRDPGGKDAELVEVADRRNAAEVESGVAGALLDAGW